MAPTWGEQKRTRIAGAGSIKKQSPFEGSVRQLRGKILALLVKHGTLTIEELCRETGLSPDRVDPVLSALAKEGFIAPERDMVKIT